MALLFEALHVSGPQSPVPVSRPHQQLSAPLCAPLPAPLCAPRPATLSALLSTPRSATLSAAVRWKVRQRSLVHTRALLAAEGRLDGPGRAASSFSELALSTAL